jgi:hypothetical protein
MNKNNHQLNKIMILVTASILGGCFDTPSSPVSPSDTKPLKYENTASFRIPDGVTEIRSFFSERKTKDWGDANNWSSAFYQNGEHIGSDQYSKFVPCRMKQPNIPTRIDIYDGTCFVNESVEIIGLEMARNSRMTIPEGVRVTNRGELRTSDVTIEGGGDFYVSPGSRVNSVAAVQS